MAATRILLGSFLLLCVTLGIVLSCQTLGQRFQFNTSNVYIRLQRNAKNQLQYQIMKGSDILDTITLDTLDTQRELAKVDENSYVLEGDGETISFTLMSNTVQGVHIQVKREVFRPETQPRDCINLDMQNTNWFGGPEDKKQYWPIEKSVFSNYALLTKEDRSLAIAERYWLNSKGNFYYVDLTTPLFIEQNSPGYENKLCFSANKNLPYDSRVENPNFIYHIFLGKNPRASHMMAVNMFLGKPVGIPDTRMVTHPIWSTWALYKADIDEQIVRDFSNNVLKYGFNNSQVEIDDLWEICYGSLTINTTRFPDMKKLTTDLKNLGFRVTMWIHPFVNKECSPYYEDFLSKGYLVLNHEGSPDTSWWNSETNTAAHLDFTKKEVQDYFTNRLKTLQTEGGIDSFKFDAGETSWVPDDPVLQGDIKNSPSLITTDYLRTVATLGPLIEVRSGWGTQDLPVFVRMIDKDSEWDWQNGLVTLITTLLEMNLNGYPYVLPDMVGGNGYNDKPPTKELFIRWLQANVFMPSIQFSFVPWNFDEETVAISKKFTALHAEYAPLIIERFELAVETGEPVNAPIWWVDPTDRVAHTIYDEFLLGETILVAPVVIEGAVKRDIYLPSGTWLDGNTKTTHTGPVWLMEYSAPLDTLPYFIRSTTV